VVVTERMPSTDEERARRALATLESPAADPRFRAALKRAFVAGELQPARAPVERPVPAPTRMPSWWRPPVLTWAAPAFAMAALALAMVIADRGPQWEVMAAAGTGVAIVDGHPVAMNQRDDLRRRIHAGARVRVPEGGALELMSRGNLGLHLEPGADVTIPAVPGRWFARAVEGQIRSGVMRITSLDRFHGARLMIVSPEAQVQVMGTTLSVIREPQGTCVCVLEGTVQVGPRGGAMVSVPGGERRFIFNDGRAPESAEMRPTEVSPLGEFHEKCAAMPGR
jgi:ferric-dicitrate binding protein FerR (iron transport regulator)